MKQETGAIGTVNAVKTMEGMPPDVTAGNPPFSSGGMAGLAASSGHGKPETAAPPARVIALWNRKGGVGKTTLAVNLADHAAREGMATLLVDADPQGSATNDLGFNANLLTATFWTPWLLRQEELPALYPVYENFDLGVCGPVADLEWQTWQVATGGDPEAGLETVLGYFERLKRGELYSGQEYRWIWLDCAGNSALDKLNFWALLAADEVILPLAVSMKGLLTQPGRDIAELDAIRERYGRPPLVVTGIIPVLLGKMTRSITEIIASNVLQEIADALDTVLLPAWMESGVVRQAESRRLPVGRMDLGRSVVRQHQARLVGHLGTLLAAVMEHAPVR